MPLEIIVVALLAYAAWASYLGHKERMHELQHPDSSSTDSNLENRP